MRSTNENGNADFIISSSLSLDSLENISNDRNKDNMFIDILASAEITNVDANDIDRALDLDKNLYTLILYKI